MNPRIRSTGNATLAAALIALGSAAHAGSPPDSAAQAVKDAWIDGRIETAFALSRHLNPLDIDTEVRDGVVHLSGTLRNDIDRDLAERIARNVEGVRKVESTIVIDSAAPTQAERLRDQAESFTQRINDAVMTAKVKTSLIANGNTKGLAIDVDTENDVVTLKGIVASRKEKMLAEMIARNTDGISTVRNQLEIREVKESS